MKTTTEDKAQVATNITPDKQLQFHICLSDAVTEEMTWSLADLECVTNKLEKEIYSITSNEQQQY